MYKIQINGLGGIECKANELNDATALATKFPIRTKLGWSGIARQPDIGEDMLSKYCGYEIEGINYSNVH